MGGSGLMMAFRVPPCCWAALAKGIIAAATSPAIKNLCAVIKAPLLETMARVPPFLAVPAAWPEPAIMCLKWLYQT